MIIMYLSSLTQEWAEIISDVAVLFLCNYCVFTRFFYKAFRRRNCTGCLTLKCAIVNGSEGKKDQ